MQLRKILDRQDVQLLVHHLQKEKHSVLSQWIYDCMVARLDIRRVTSGRLREL